MAIYHMLYHIISIAKEEKLHGHVIFVIDAEKYLTKSLIRDKNSQ